MYTQREADGKEKEDTLYTKDFLNKARQAMEDYDGSGTRLKFLDYIQQRVESYFCPFCKAELIIDGHKRGYQLLCINGSCEVKPNIFINKDGLEIMLEFLKGD